MENNDLNNRVLDKLENKIAILEFKEKEKAKKPHKILKVASFLILTSLIAGNAYTFTEYKKDFFSYVLDKIGIFQNYERDVNKVNQVQESNDITITLETYSMDKETLIIGYNIKTKNQIDYINNISEKSKIVDGNDLYYLNKRSFSPLYKINDNEYEMYRYYNINSEVLSENAIFYSELTLYEHWDSDPDIEEEPLGKWNFELKLDKSKLDLEYEEYNIKNKKIITNDYGLGLSIYGFKRSKMVSKLDLFFNDYSTDPSIAYYIEIHDDKGNVILENGIESIVGGIESEIVFSRIDLNSEIEVILNETEIDKNMNLKVLKSISIKIDLSKDLELKKENKEDKKEGTFKNIKFEYPENMKIQKNSNDFIWFYLYNTIDGIEVSESYNTLIYNKNIFNYNLEKIVDDMRKLEKTHGYGGVIRKEYSVLVELLVDGYHDKWIKVPEDQMIKVIDGENVEIDGYTITKDLIDYDEKIEISDAKKISINGIDMMTYTRSAGAEIDKIYVFTNDGEIYVARIKLNFKNKGPAEDFVNSIKLK